MIFTILCYLFYFTSNKGEEQGNKISLIKPAFKKVLV